MPFGFKMTPRVKNVAAAVTASLCALTFMFVVNAIKYSEPPEPNMLLNPHWCLAAMFGTAASSWKAFPHLGKQVGTSGVFRDLAIVALAVLISAIIAGTLIVPVTGTIGGPIFLVMEITDTPALLLIFIVGASVALLLSRAK